MIKVADFYDSFYKWAGPEAVLDWPKKKILAAMPQENPKGRRNDSQWCFGNISLTPRKESEGKRPKLVLRGEMLKPVDEVQREAE